ncbi:MAG: hypothetical protein ABSG88_18235 [Bradyrhizobium sp.]
MHRKLTHRFGTGKQFFNSAYRRLEVSFDRTNPAHRRAGFKPVRCPCQNAKLDSALKLQRFQSVTFFAARYCALFGANCLRVFNVPYRARSTKMTSEDIEVVVRAMTSTVEGLEAGPVKQSMLEATTQVIAHVVAARGFCRDKI